MLFLRLLGGPSLCGNGSTLTGPATQRHRLALLALLASSRSRPQSRDKLVAWLWPERDMAHARNLLNQGVHARLTVKSRASADRPINIRKIIFSRSTRLSSTSCSSAPMRTRTCTKIRMAA